MRKRWMVGSIAIAAIGLAGMKAVTLAQQKPARVWVQSVPISQDSKLDRARWKSPADGPPRPVASPVGDDPMVGVDSFLQRSRKETDDSIKALGQEAEALRVRLQKVEAALGRWQAVAAALSQDDKLRWGKPEPENAIQLEPIGEPKETTVPPPGGLNSEPLPTTIPAPIIEPIPALPPAITETR